VDCNNTGCSNVIKCFKFKLWRKVKYMQSSGNMVETGEYLNEMKMEGCKAKEQCTRFYEIPLPEMEHD